MRTLQCFQKKFFCPQKVEKNHPQKLLRKTQIHLFSPYCPDLPKQPKQKNSMFQNVAYRPTVYRTGSLGHTNTELCP